MSDTTTTETVETTEAASQTSADTSTTEATATEAATATEGDEKALGDAGKKALDAMKAKWKEAEAKAKSEAEARAALEAKINGQEAEHKAQMEAQRVKDEALAAANERILKAEIRAAAASKLADPADALRFINLSEFEVGEDGSVDAEAVNRAISDLINDKPYLAAQGGQRFQGSADGGARNGSAKPAQLTEADVRRLSAEGKYDEITQAKADGRLNDYLGIKS